MNNIDKLFSEKQNNLLSVFFTAGFPNLTDTRLILKELQAAGADMVEVGIPFSDAVADGEIIQHASEKALQNGMSLRLIFEQLKGFRNEIHIPVLLMGYFNSILQFGIKNFVAKCAETGIDGVIIPDLPLDFYIENYEATFNANNLYNIQLISSASDEETILKVNQHSKGFIYVLSNRATTGTKAPDGLELQALQQKTESLAIELPLLTGFGIKDAATFATACKTSSGAIIGSAFTKILTEKGASADTIQTFIQQIKN